MSIVRNDNIVRIDNNECTGCGYCILVCPEDAIRRDDEYEIRIVAGRCVACKRCTAVCPSAALLEGPRPVRSSKTSPKGGVGSGR